MSIPGIIYCIGGICAVIIMAYVFFNDLMEDEDVRVKDLGLLVLIDTLAFLTSWAAVITALFLRYEDKVIIKRKK